MALETAHGRMPARAASNPNETTELQRKIHGLEADMRDLKKKHDDEKLALDAKHKGEVAKLKDQSKAQAQEFRSTISSLSQELEVDRISARKLNATLEQHTARMAAMEQELVETLAEMQTVADGEAALNATIADQLTLLADRDEFVEELKQSIASLESQLVATEAERDEREQARLEAVELLARRLERERNEPTPWASPEPRTALTPEEVEKIAQLREALARANLETIIAERLANSLQSELLELKEMLLLSEEKDGHKIQKPAGRHRAEIKEENA